MQAASGIAAPAPSRHYAKMIGVAAAVVLLGLVVYFWQAKRQGAPTSVAASSTTVAVLPLQDLGADKNTDYLRLALADEIANALSYSRSLSIRPFATTSKYTQAGLDLQQVGREMKVSDIVTGHYLKEGDQLQITLEAVDVENNRTLWRDTLNVAAPDMIAMRSKVTDAVREQLLPALGAGTDTTEASTRPKSEEAYDLYLRSLALPHDPGPNKEAIPMLERAVGLDPTYAPAWGNLGRRYYLDSQYGGGGEAMFQKSNAALDRALALDPNFSLAIGQTVANLTESGELVKAYQRAQDLIARQPKNPMGHFVMGYVLRYAGQLEESAKACNEAMALDSGNYVFRACSFTFSQMGNPQRALDFLNLDAGSNFYKKNVVRVYLREGKLAEAKEAAKALPDGFYTACVERDSPTQPLPAEVEKNIRDHEAEMLANHDPENRYLYATDITYCGEKTLPLQLLKSAIESKYCIYEALQKDPMLEPLRSAPEFPQLLNEAKECQDKFLAERAQLSH